MKKITLLLVCFLALHTANAQVTIKPGIRAGLNLATLTNTNLDTKADFYVGGFVAIKLAKFYTLQPELTYSRQGATGSGFYNADYYYGYDPVIPAYGGSNDTDYSLQYLSLGVMNKFNIIDGFHAIVGPTLDFKVGDNFTGYAADELMGVDLGLNAGLGYTLPMGLTIEARYKIGFADIFGDNYSGYNDDYYYDDNGNYDDVILNSVVQLGLSYAF
ncbi:porin family protein [Flavobacterium subsaxonicum]|uniref:Outer membrane protein beta-barrel domain-containing protein n=1 Tax=Flavobacterium subsaxonicum WB 4.1-42 = DSM 21790 TaxID=1121898 RepID=A0A0A2MSU2_9FLAO|nr:porin family protein [Flavobacterium subsaxonicum]KGO91300.1 hypothetical protein Q766_18660 [Flavobacterium subsaxonicum WB 4.1-42 = DSM 21790]